MAIEKNKRHPVQVNSATYEAVREMSRLSGSPMNRIVERAVEHYRYELMLHAHNAAWSALMEADPEAIVIFEAEDRMWSRSNSDGLCEQHSGDFA